MSHDITVNGSLIGAAFEVAVAVENAMDFSTEDFPGRLIRVHDIDGESVLAEVRDGVLVLLAPGILVSPVTFPKGTEQKGEVIEPSEEHTALLAHLPEDMRAKTVCVRWAETRREKEAVLWSPLAGLRIEGYIEPVTV